MRSFNKILTWLFLILSSGWIFFSLLRKVEDRTTEVEISIAYSIQADSSASGIVIIGKLDTLDVNHTIPSTISKRVSIRELRKHDKIKLFSKSPAKSLSIESVALDSWFISKEYSGKQLNGLFKIKPRNVQDRDIRKQVSKEGISWLFADKPFEIISTDELTAPFFRRLIALKFSASIVFVLILAFLFHKKVTETQLLPEKGKVAFSGFLLITLLFMLSKPSQKSLEKRKLAEFPSLSENHIWSLPEKVDDWYKDHFPWRNELPPFFNFIKLKLLDQTPIPNKVAKGKDGWFYSVDYDVRGAYQGIELYSNEELETIKTNIEERRDFVRSYGGEYYFMLCPLKHMVYPEFLPDGTRQVKEQNKYNQLLEYLTENSTIQVIQLLDTLKAAKNKEQIYYKTDTHWNQYGAYLAYKSILNQLEDNLSTDNQAISLPPIQVDFEWIEHNFGDMVGQMNLTPFITTRICYPKNKTWNATELAKTTYPKLKFDGPPYYWFQCKEAKVKKKIMFYRDSYSVYLIPYFSDTFEQSSYFWTRTFHAAPIADEKPDIFIEESLARFIDSFLKENEPEVKARVAQFRASQQ